MEAPGKSRLIEVCLSPALLPYYTFDNSIVVVIDIFRATSSICYGFENGAQRIIPVATVEECESYRGQDLLLAAERNGEVVQGFDFGNSPFSYTRDKVDGKTIILTTTNGTYAINEARRSHQVIVGSFLNLSAVASWLKQQDQDVLLLCAGWKNQVNLEDTLFAGAVVNKLKGEFVHFCDASVAAEDLYLAAKDDLPGYLQKSSHSMRMKELNIEKDISFCLNIDICSVIPVLEENALVRMAFEPAESR